MITFFEKIMWKQQSSRKYERNHHKDIIKSFSFILCLLTIISFKVLDENNIILLWCWARDGITAPSIHSHTKELQKVKVFHAYELRARALAWARLETRRLRTTVGNRFNEGRQKVLYDICDTETPIHLIDHFNAVKMT